MSTVLQQQQGLYYSSSSTQSIATAAATRAYPYHCKSKHSIAAANIIAAAVDRLRAAAADRVLAAAADRVLAAAACNVHNATVMLLVLGLVLGFFRVWCRAADYDVLAPWPGRCAAGKKTPEFWDSRILANSRFLKFPDFR